MDLFEIVPQGIDGAGVLLESLRNKEQKDLEKKKHFMKNIHKTANCFGMYNVFYVMFFFLLSSSEGEKYKNVMFVM